MSARVCRKCGVTKPLDEFSAYLTTAQAVAQGYSGTRRIKGTSQLCKACRSKKTYGKTKRQLDNEVTLGHMTALEHDTLMQKRKAHANKLKQRVANCYWSSKRAEAWEPLLVAARRENNRVTMRIAKLDREWASGNADYAAEQAFIARYAPMVSRLVTTITQHIRHAHPALPNTTIKNPSLAAMWESALRDVVTTDDEINEIKNLKRRVPPRPHEHRNLESVLLAQRRPKPPRQKPGRKPRGVEQ